MVELFPPKRFHGNGISRSYKGVSGSTTYYSILICVEINVEKSAMLGQPSPTTFQVLGCETLPENPMIPGIVAAPTCCQCGGQADSCRRDPMCVIGNDITMDIRTQHRHI